MADGEGVEAYQPLVGLRPEMTENAFERVSVFVRGPKKTHERRGAKGLLHGLPPVTTATDAANSRTERL